MANTFLGPIDELIEKIGPLQGVGFSFAEGQNTTGAQTPQQKTGLFDTLSTTAQGVKEGVSDVVKPAQNLSKQISKGIAKSIETGINAIFDVGLSEEDKQTRQDIGGQTPSEKLQSAFSGQIAPLPDQPTLRAEIPQQLALQPEDQPPQTFDRVGGEGRNRFAELVEQQRKLRNQIRGRRV